MATNSDGSIVLTVTIDKNGLEKELSAINSNVKKGTGSINSFGKSISNVTAGLGKFATAVGIAFSVAQMVKFSNEASKLAAQTEAYILRIGQIYGEAGKQVSDFIDVNSQALGMSKTAAYEAAASYGNLFSSFADGAENAKLTNDMLQTTAVIASKTGRTFDEVFTKIQSGIFGNTRAIDDLGVYVNQATITTTKAFQTISDGRPWAQLTGNEQKQILTLAILEQAQAKYGNTVLQSTALTRSQFNAAFQDFKATWGQVINLVLMPVLKVLTAVFNYATMALKAVLAFFGKEVKVTGGAMSDISAGSAGIADNIDNATNSQKGLTKSVKDTNKEVKKTLAGFDELQILSDNTKSGSGAGGGTGGGASGGSVAPNISGGGLEITDAANVDTAPWENLKTTLQEISAIFMSGFWEGFGKADFSAVSTSLEGISNKLKTMFSSPEVSGAAESFSNSFIESLGKISGSVSSIGITIATNLLNGFEQYLSTNIETIQTRITNIFNVGSKMNEIVGNLWTAFANIFSVTAQENGVNLTSNIIGIFSNAGLGIAELAIKIGTDFINFLAQPIIDNQESIKATLDGVLGVFASITGSIKELVDNLINDVLALYDEHVSPFIQTLTDTLSEWVGKFVDGYNEHIKPVIDAFATEFQSLVQDNLVPMFDTISEYVGKVTDILNLLWDNVLKPLGSWIIDNFLHAFSNTFTQIKDIVFTVAGSFTGYINDMFTSLNGLIDFITGVFTGDWKKAWNGIKNIFKGIINGLINGIETGINAIIIAINGLIGGIDTLVGAVGSTLGLDWSIPKLKKVKLTKLAQGAVLPANKPFLAMVGDQKNGTNIEAPAKLIKQMAMEAIIEANANNQGQTVKEEHYYLDQTELMSILYKLVKGGERLKGNSLLN